MIIQFDYLEAREEHFDTLEKVAEENIMWAVRGILCLLVLLTLTVYSFQYTTLRPPSGDPNTLSGCWPTYLADQGEVHLSLTNDDCYYNGVTFYNWTLLTSPHGVRQQIGTCYGCRDPLCSTTLNNGAFSVQDSHSLVIRNMTQQYSGWEVRAEAYTRDGRLVLSQHCLLNVSLLEMSDTTAHWYNMLQSNSAFESVGSCRTVTSLKEGDQLKWMLRPAYGLPDTDQHEYTLATCTYRTPPTSQPGNSAPGAVYFKGWNDHFTCDNTVYRDGYNVNGDLGVRSRASWGPDGRSPLELATSANGRFVSDMQGSLICQYTSGEITASHSRPIMLYRPGTVDNCSVNVQKQSAILSCDVSNVYSSDRNFTFSVVAKFKYSSQYDYQNSKGTSGEFTLFTGSYADGLTAYTNSGGALVYRGRLEYAWSLGRCVGAYHQIRVLVWPGPDSAHPTGFNRYGYYKTYDGVITYITQIVNVGHPEWLPDMEGGNDSISLQDDGPASVFCNNGYNRPHTWEQDRPTWEYYPVSRGLNRAAKVGIAVGCSGAFVLLLVIVCMVHRRCGDVREVVVRKCGPVREVVVRKGGHACEYVRAHTPSPPFTGLQVEADLWRRLSMWRKKKDSKLFFVTAGPEDKTPLKDSNPDQTELLRDIHGI